jgi:nicotinamide mononucleotide transporter
MVTLYIFIFYRAKLYSDMLLQVVYIGLQIYGWHAWLRGGPERTHLPVTTISAPQAAGWLVGCAVTTAAWGALMHYNTDASFPYADAFTTVASLIAQWLLGRKKLQSWLVWIVVDVVSIRLYLAKELYLTAALYCVFLIMATLGYIAWKSSFRAPAPA